MNKDQGIGLVVLVASVVGIVLYAWLIYAFTILVLQITAFIAVAGMLGIAAWIGWTMATTPPPAPLEPEAAETPASPESGSVSSVTKPPAGRALGELRSELVQRFCRTLQNMLLLILARTHARDKEQQAAF